MSDKPAAKTANRPGGLGRGLAALLGDESREAAFDAPSQDQLLRVPVGLIVPNPQQPRTSFDAAALEELSESIRLHGILAPLLVRREGAGFVLLAGERRLRAAKLAGLADVPVFVRAAGTDSLGQLELALIENLQREDLDPVEAALGYQKLIQDYRYNQEQVAQRVGKDRATVANTLRLLRLPADGARALRSGLISAGHARALLPLEDPAQFSLALATVTAKDLSVRATEELVRTLRRPAAKGPPPDRTLVRLGESLTRTLGTRVAVAPKKDGSGKIVIEYHDASELDRLVGLFGPR
jgi:ParB family chromosome partitioning protein